MHARQSHKNDLDYQTSANSQSSQNYNGLSGGNSYGQNGFGSGNQNSIDGFQPKSFLTQNNSPKSPFLQNTSAQQAQQKGSLIQNNYSANASNSSTKRDYLSSTNRLQQGQSPTQQQYQQQQQQQQLQQQQQQQKNNFFNTNKQPYEQFHDQSTPNSYSQNQHQAQSHLANDNAIQQNNGFIKKNYQQSLSLQPQTQQYQQQYQQGQANKLFQQDVTADHKKNKENLANISQAQQNSKISSSSSPSSLAPSTPIQISPPSTSHINSYSKGASNHNGNGTKPSPREGYSQSTQASTQNSTRQQLRASTSNSQIDSRGQRYSNSNLQQMQTLKNTVSDSKLQHQNYLKENAISNQGQDNQDYPQHIQKGHMYQSGIVPSSPQMFVSGINQHMKRSEIIESKSGNYLNQQQQQNSNTNKGVNRPKSHSKNDIDLGENKKDQYRVQSAMPYQQNKKMELEQKSSNKYDDTESEQSTYQSQQQRNQSLSQLSYSKNNQDRKNTQHKSPNNQQNSIQLQDTANNRNQKPIEQRAYSEEYQEYKKLQEKLNYLETKIMSIKSNIDSNCQKTKDESTKDSQKSAFKQREPSASFQNQGSSSASKQIQGQQQKALAQQPQAQGSNSTSQISANKNSFNYFQSQKSNNQGSSSSKNSRDQESTSNQPSQGNSFFAEQSTTKQLTKSPSTSSSSNLQKNINLQQNVAPPEKSQEPKSNPLASFVTQVSRGSGIPLSPKTATNLTKKNKLEEKITSAAHLDSSNSANILQANIPKSYLNNKLSSSAMKNQEGKGVVNSSYSKKREDSDSFEGYQPSSAKNSKSSSGLQNQKANTNSGSLKNSNIFTNPSSTGSSGHKKQSPPFIYYVSPIIKAYSDSLNLSPFSVLAREHLIQTMMAINFSRMLKPAPQKTIDEKKIYLPTRRDNKKTLVFDLDETLIHCNENASIPSDVMLPIKFPSGETIQAGINIRPYCLEILEELSKLYEIVIFTASHSCYANVVLDYLDPNSQYISARLFRENCVTTEDGVYIKDLRVIANRNMSDMVLVDNAAYSFGYQIDNGIPIIPFYDNKSDLELKHLTQFMKSVHNVRDLRDIMRKFLKVGQYCDFNDPHHLISTLFDDLI